MIRRSDAIKIVHAFYVEKVEEIYDKRNELEAGEIDSILVDNKILSGKIKDIPPVEAVPVIRGEWIDTQPGFVNGFYRNAHYCSNCRGYYTTEYDGMKFCPNCGADMRKKVKE